MKKQTQQFEQEIRNALRGKTTPILVLDQRWHELFPYGEKPGSVIALEEQLNQLLQRQGKLVNEIKELKKVKKRLMAGIVSGMNTPYEKSKNKKDNQQRLFLETKERIETDSRELMTIPKQIQKKNEELLIVGAVYCLEKLQDGDARLELAKKRLEELQQQVKEAKTYKEDLEKQMDIAYSLMHGVLGHDVMNLFDSDKYEL